MSSEAYSDRSSSITYLRCHRKYWWEHCVPTDGAVPGIRPNKLDMNLLVGSAAHMGWGNLLADGSVDEAVGRALEGYGEWKGFWPLLRSYGLILGENEDASYVANEQAAMVEGLIRAYHVYCLPLIRERFEVLEVEKEDLAVFDEIPGFRLNWGMKGDALLMERDTLNLYVLSLKTTKEWGKRDEDSARHDMQGISECATTDQRLEKCQKFCDQFGEHLIKTGPNPPEWFGKRYKAGAPPQVSGVKMEFGLKGRRSQYPEDSGIWTYANPLIRPWKKSDDLGSGRSQYAVRFSFKDEWGGGHRLGKGWNRINIWEDIGVKEWVGMLANESVQGFPAGTGLEERFVLPVEYFRNDDDIERWKKRSCYRAKRIEEGKKACLEALGESQERFEDLLDEYFEPNTSACDWPTKCEYQDICYGPKGYLFNPMASGLYTIREANHKIEEVFA